MVSTISGSRTTITPKARRRAVQTEKCRRPKRVRGKLPAPQAQRRRRAQALPDQPSGDPNHDIEHGPDWREHDTRWCSWRRMQCQIPMMHGSHRHGAADGADKQAQSDETHQRQP